MIGTLDIYAAEPQDWDSSKAAAPQANAGLVASLLTAAVTAPGTRRAGQGRETAA